MKIAFIVYNEYPGLLPSGGIGIFVRNLAEGLAEAGFQASVLLISGNAMKPTVINDASIVPLHIHSNSTRWSGMLRPLRVYKAVRDYVNTQTFDVVEVSTSDAFMLGRIKGPLIVARTHGSLTFADKRFKRRGGLFTQLMKRRHEHVDLKTACAILCVSDSIYSHYAAYRPKARLLKNFVSPEFTELCRLARPIANTYIFYHSDPA